jgi:hypothetical protein
MTLEEHQEAKMPKRQTCIPMSNTMKGRYPWYETIMILEE